MMNRSDTSLEPLRPQPITPVRGEVSALRPVPLPWEFSNDSGASSIVQIWRVLRARVWLLAGCALATLLLALGVSLLTTKQFDASARILLELQNADALGLEQAINPANLDTNTRLQTQIRVLQSNTIAAEVFRQLGLHQKKEFAGKLAQSSGFDELSLPSRTRLLALFQRSLNVQLIPKTQIIEIRFRSADPRLASEVANSLAANFIEHNFQTKYRATQQTSTWLTQQLDDLKKRAQVAQDNLLDYQRQTGILGVDEIHNIITAKLDELNKQLSTAEGERIVKEARYRITRAGSSELIANMLPESVLGALQKRRAEARSQYAQLGAKYGPSYPRLVQLRSDMAQLDVEIEEQTQRLIEQARAEYEASLTAEQMLAASFSRQKQEAYKLNENAIQYAILRRDVESSRELYEGLLRKLKEAGILASLKSSNMNIVDPASPPVEPAVPNLPMNLGLGLMSGLLAGVAAAFLLESADSSIRTPDDVESYCGLPSLGMIPRVRAASHAIQKLRAGGEAKNPNVLITLAHPNSGAAEAFRALRTSLLLSSWDSPPRTTVVTSALAGDGKTFTAMNLAVVLTQAQQRVLLVEADMRRPTIHTVLTMPRQAGLSGCLSGTLEPSSVITEIREAPGLYAVMAGYSPPYPSEMLASRRMQELLQHWRSEFDYIVIDTPPILAVTDAVICASMADAVVLVARSQKTGRQSLLRAREILQRAKARIVGALVNDVALDSDSYYAYYGNYAQKQQLYYHPEPRPEDAP